jgi:hypothetical protein
MSASYKFKESFIFVFLRPIINYAMSKTVCHSVVSLRMVVGKVQASGYLNLERRKDGAGHQRIDIHVVEEYRKM